jgi:syntaxin 6
MKKTSELGMPLTASMDDDEEECYNNSSGGDSSIISSAVTPPAKATSATSTFIGEDDPFYMFRGDLTKKILLVDQELSRYTTLVQTTDTATNTHAIKEAKKQLKRHIKHAESTLADLETTVRVVERQREKFPHIHDGEMEDRKEFVRESKSRINNSKMMMQSEEMKQKFLRDERSFTERRRGANTGSAMSPDLEQGNASTNNNNNGITGSNYSAERSETMLMMKQQDETLDDLDLAVTRVGYLAETIHEEIESQNKMLTELEDDLADAEEQLGVVMGKLAKLLKTKSRCQIGLILILSLIVLVLFFLVLYT